MSHCYALLAIDARMSVLILMVAAITSMPPAFTPPPFSRYVAMSAIRASVMMLRAAALARVDDGAALFSMPLMPRDAVFDTLDVLLPSLMLRGY